MIFINITQFYWEMIRINLNKVMRCLSHILLIWIILFLFSCRTTQLPKENSYTISPKDIHYNYITGVYSPTLSFRKQIEKYIYRNFSWDRAGYVYKNSIQGRSIIQVDYDLLNSNIKGIRILMSTNIASVDEELIYCVRKLHFVNVMKGNQNMVLRFLLRVRYNKIRN